MLSNLVDIVVPQESKWYMHEGKNVFYKGNIANDQVFDRQVQCTQSAA